jgi:hypothetical protein
MARVAVAGSGTAAGAASEIDKVTTAPLEKKKDAEKNGVLKSEIHHVSSRRPVVSKSLKCISSKPHHF